MTQLKKILILLILLSFFISQHVSAYAQVLMPEYLCELGINFYQQGRFAEALQEFRKALIISPGYEAALKYINLIQGQQPTAVTLVPPETPVPAPAEAKPERLVPRLKGREETVREALDRIEGRMIVLPAPAAVPLEVPPAKEKITALPAILMLDKDEIEALRFPLEIERGKSISVRGSGITRFLVTQPDVITAEKMTQEEVLVTGRELGYTYLHIWDSRGRWTLGFLVTSPKPAGPTLEEEMRREVEKAGTFKLKYSVGWSAFEVGRRLYDLEQQSKYGIHWLGLTGQTPYGDINSSVSLRSLRNSTDLTYFTAGLERGSIGPFKDFTLRAFDYNTPGVANLVFSGKDLRGAMLKSPAFNNTLDYTIFWGREGGGRYGGLSAGLIETRDSFISGLDVNFYPRHRQNYSFSVFRGWGSDRPDDLNPYGYDIAGGYGFDNWRWGWELAYDSETFAHLLNVNYFTPKLNFTSELRNTDRNFRTMTGWGWRAGELGLLSTFSYVPSDRLSMSGWLDLFQDKLYPNPEESDRWNEDLNWDLTYAIDPLTSWRLDFAFQNELGRISPLRYHSLGIGLYRTLELIKKFNTFLQYRHQESKYFYTPSSDYVNDKIILGLRFSLIGDLYYYVNREFNWLESRYNRIRSCPQFLETGVDWYGRIFSSPFWGNLRFFFRDEEDAASPLSLLAGEDYIEGYAELSYRPNPDIEEFLSARFRNIWADNPAVNKRVEVDFYVGLRYLWDTGLRWESVGTIEGYVFKDINGNGLKEEGEPPVEGVEVWLGKDKTSTTGKDGRYVFLKVRAKKAYVNVDTANIPSGFVLTVPAAQEAAIAHNQTTRIDFGITSRTEIAGLVFDDIDGDGKFGPPDQGIRGVSLTLEDGSKAATDDSGRYVFKKVSTGEHTLTLELNTLPPQYIPAVPIYKKVILFEGVSYIHNIPLKKSGE